MPQTLLKIPFQTLKLDKTRGYQLHLRNVSERNNSRRKWRECCAQKSHYRSAIIVANSFLNHILLTYTFFFLFDHFPSRDTISKILNSRLLARTKFPIHFFQFARFCRSGESFELGKATSAMVQNWVKTTREMRFCRYRYPLWVALLTYVPSPLVF